MVKGQSQVVLVYKKISCTSMVQLILWREYVGIEPT